MLKTHSTTVIKLLHHYSFISNTGFYYYLVSIYKCEVNREDCSICFTAPADWKCGWCKSSNKCYVKGACDDRTYWIDKDCPDPVISNVSRPWCAK